MASRCGLEDMGVRSFDVGETPKDGTSLSKVRTEIRSIRRRVRRRKHRIERTRHFLVRYGIVTKNDLNSLYDESFNIYKLRVKALDNILPNRDLARVLLNLVKKRGYKSNVEIESRISDEDGKVSSATKENQKIMNDNGYRTVAEMYLNNMKFKVLHPSGRFISKIRNTTGKYHSTVLRQSVREEALFILESQKRFNDKITSDFIEDYLKIFDSQRNYHEGPSVRYTISPVNKMLGKCIFEKQENRAVKASYSFEYFDILRKINNIIIEKHIIKNNTRQLEKRKLTKDERQKVINLVKYQCQVRYYDIRKELNLSEYERFSGLDYGFIKEFSDGVNKSVERKAKIEGFIHYFRMKQALYYVDSTLFEKLSVTQLNQIAYTLTVYKNNEARLEQFAKYNINLPSYAIQELLKISFVEIAYLSLKAIEKINPYMEQGLTYKNALNKAYPTLNPNRQNINSEILNAVSRRAISQTIKVLNAIVNKYGNPDLVVVQFEDEIDYSRTERDKLVKLKQENMAKTEKIKLELMALGIDKPSGTDIAKYKLWTEQSNYCMYSSKKIPLEILFTDQTAIDYIIPFHMCFDDTYKNKLLVLGSEAKQKGNNLPYSYMQMTQRDLKEYETRVSMLLKRI